MRLTVIDLDGSTVGQAPVARRLASGAGYVHDRRDLGGALRLWSFGGEFDRLARTLPPVGRGEVVMLGSGDYHHVTAALLARLDRTFTLVHLDNHPDWAWTVPARHCGSWINAALTLPCVRKVVTIGCCSSDLATPDRRGTNLAALRSGRLQTRPWLHPPTRLRGAADPVPGHRVEEGFLHWSTLGDLPWDAALVSLAEDIPSGPVWISLDKDVLVAQDAATNWDQGGMRLAQVVEVLGFIAARHRILGADLCGDYSPARHRHPAKLLESWIDQPLTPPRDLSVNEDTNERLLSLFEDIL